MHPRKHRSHSARARGESSAPWGVAVPLLDPKEDPSKSENDRSVVSKSKKRTRSNQGQCSTPPCRASERIKKRPRKYSSEEVATEFPGCVDPKNRGKRSVRPRGNTPARTPWVMPLDGFQNLGTAAGKPRSVGSEIMDSTPGGTAPSSGDVPKDLAKVEEKGGAAIEQNNVSVVDDLAEVTEGNGAGADCSDEQIGVADCTSLDAKDSNHGDGGDNAVAELKMSSGADANSVVQAGVPATDTLTDHKESNGSVAETHDNTAVQTNDDFDPLKDRANDAAEFDSKTISGLDLDDGNVSFDLSSAESVLASLYGESDRDMCIEFAVKLLMNETPLPKEAAEIEEFFIQEIQGGKSARRQRQEEPSNVCSAWGNLQSDKLLLTSRC